VRIEIPFTRGHWEAAHVAPRFALARGWQRQLDTGRNPLFYEVRLDDEAYSAWLAENGVRYVALPSVPLDYSSIRERELVARDPPYLALRMRTPAWRVYEVLAPRPLAIPERDTRATLTELRADELTLDFRSAGAATVRVRWTPYWRARDGCVEPAGEWMRVTASRPGPVRVTTTFAPSRLLSRGGRCG
jgi:hypothetical protein